MAGSRGLRLADEKQEEVIKAAKSLFSKRTRTLYHWLYPDTSKTKLKATVSAAWDTLADAEKQFYLSQVSLSMCELQELTTLSERLPNDGDGHILVKQDG